MKRKILKILVIILVLVIVLAISFTIAFNLYQKAKEQSILEEKLSTSTTKYNNVTQNLMEGGEITNITEDTVIEGLVESKSNGVIYIFGGQHFGEFGYEIEEYITANIQDEKQVCIDYFTSEEYDTSYIEEGDLLICSGDLIEKERSVVDTVFDTKDNSIIVLKSSDYSKMKTEALNETREIPSVITVGQIFTNNDGKMYLKYDIEDDKHQDKSYHFPFIEEVYITDNTEIKGDLQEGKEVKVQYDEPKKGVDRLGLKSIEVIK